MDGGEECIGESEVQRKELSLSSTIFSLLMTLNEAKTPSIVHGIQSDQTLYVTMCPCQLKVLMDSASKLPLGMTSPDCVKIIDKGRS